MQPMSNRPDISDTSLKVNRTFEAGHSNKLAVTDEENEISSLHCPSFVSGFPIQLMFRFLVPGKLTYLKHFKRFLHCTILIS